MPPNLNVDQVLNQIKKQLPGREAQLDLLASHIGPDCSSSSPLFIYGPPGSGKSSVVRDLLGFLQLRHAYVNCNYAAKPKTILTSLLNQIKGSKRKRSDNYDCSTKCDSINDFLLLLPPAVARAPGGTSWLVLDNAQRLAGTELLSALMRVRDVTGAAVSLILISTLPWSSGAYSRDTHSILPPITIPFTAYTKENIIKILELRYRKRHHDESTAPPLSAPYHQFLNTFVPLFMRASNNLLDMQAAVDLLWPKYSKPLRDGKNLQGPALVNLIKPDIQRVVSDLDLSPPPIVIDAQRPLTTAGDSSTSALVSTYTTTTSNKTLALEMPFLSKYLLLAAYVASRNKPTTDRAVFDPTHKQRGKRDAKSSDKRAEAAMEAELRGPHSFALERLLAIFYCLHAQSGSAEDDERLEKPTAAGTSSSSMRSKHSSMEESQHAEVMMQLSTLVALRLLSHSGGDLLEGGYYRCNVTETVAQAVARNLKLRLEDYLRLG